MMHNLFRRLIAWIGVFVCLGAVPAAQALLVVGDSGAGSIYTNSAGAGSGWNHVGYVVGNNSSATYVGNGWFMTANHVWGALSGGGAVNLGGSDYSVNTGTYTAMTNSNGSAADLCMFRVSNLSGLPADLSMSTSPSTSSQLRLIGNGFDNSGSVGMTWGNGLLVVSGVNPYFTNVVDAENGYSTECFISAYQSSAEGIAYGQTYDSGGGVFQDDALVGIMIGIDPDFIADGATFITHLDPYVGQINATLAIPEPATVGLLAGIGAGAFLVRRWFLI